MSEIVPVLIQERDDKGDASLLIEIAHAIIGNELIDAPTVSGKLSAVAGRIERRSRPGIDLRGHIPPVQHILKLFRYEHLPEGELRDTSAKFAALAVEMADRLPDNPEKTVALRNLKLAKDAAVCAFIADREEEELT